MSDVLIQCEDVGKVFCRDLKRSLWYGVCDIASELLVRDSTSMPASSESRQLRPQEFWAVRDISFEVRRGECVGLIGRNGAGKTTLLKMLNGLIKPEVGRIRMRGRVGAMIALGAGFNPVLTARENVFVNGSILGLSRRQIRDRFDAIIEFAELQEFVDTPVRNYSSGMQIRLGFAVAVILIQPDVLLLDEILAVGDAGFRSKCYNAVMDMASNAAVILVSHSMPQIARLSTQIVLMSGGVATSTDNVAEGIQAYFDQFPRRSAASVVGGGVRIQTLTVDDAPPTESGGDACIAKRDDVLIRLELELDAPLKQAICVFSFFDPEQKNVARTDCRFQSIPAGRSTVQVHIPQCPLTPGNYDMQIVFSDAANPARPRHLVRYDPYCRVSVKGSVAMITCTSPVLFDSSQVPVQESNTTSDSLPAS